MKQAEGVPPTERGPGADKIAPAKYETALLDQWKARISAAQHAHYYMMGRLWTLHAWLGVPVVVLTAVVGTSLFATLARSNSSTSSSLRATLALISVAAAILSALQMFFKFGERAEKHAIAADWFSAVPRVIEQHSSIRPASRTSGEVVGDLRKEINKIVQNSPQLASGCGTGSPPSTAPVSRLTSPPAAKGRVRLPHGQRTARSRLSGPAVLGHTSSMQLGPCPPRVGRPDRRRSMRCREPDRRSGFGREDTMP
jgi:hypothetical protein